jgi:hypothetical protein
MQVAIERSFITLGVTLLKGLLYFRGYSTLLTLIAEPDRCLLSFFFLIRDDY